MPAPLIAAAGIAAGTQLLGTGLSGISTANQNKKSRQFSEKMYDRQYRDNLDFWNKQNTYNSPEKQMERLKAAGLNPNLLYGKGGGAANTADRIGTPDVKNAQFKTPDFSGVSQSGTSFVNQYFDTQIKAAQYDNLKADNTVKMADVALKLATADRSKFDLKFEKQLETISADVRKESLRKLKAETSMSLSENERRAAMNSANLKTAAESVLRMRMQNSKDAAEINRIKAAIKNINKDTQLKALDKELWEMGVTRSDDLWQRMLSRMLNQYMSN